MIYYVIPARKGSKGLPRKNRRLFELTANIIPEALKNSTVVSTDDEYIKQTSEDYGFNVHNRTPNVSLDTTSTTELLKQVASSFKMSTEDEIVLLYLTYPQRTFDDVENIYEFYKQNNGTTLLCKQEATTHPYMCYYDLPENRGMRVINHDLYRRQDYPSCFFVSYFVAILKVEYLNVVNKNLYHPQTIFYPLDYDSIDIDTQEDLEK